MTPDNSLAFLSHPVVVAGLTVFVVAFANFIVRRIERTAKTPSRLAALELAHEEMVKAVTPLQLLPDQVAAIHDQQAQEGEFKRTMLVVTGHQTAALSVLLEVTKGKKVNGNVDGALKRMDEAQKATDDYLVKTATGGK